MSSSSRPEAAARALRALARALGFADAHIARVADVSDMTQRLAAFLDAGRHGEMTWLSGTASRRAHPAKLWPEAKSAIVLAMSYAPERDPMENLAARASGNISVYARGRDYHEVIKGKLKTLAQRLHALTGADAKVFVDTAALMEKPLAQEAGLGWQGRHTNLVSRDLGSWFFLGVVLTDADLPPDAPETDRCGTCRACLDICPTNAFPAPYQLDARRCISYLTIEHKGPIPRDLRPAMGNRIFGCDDCLAVCPWNKFAKDAREAKLAARADLALPPLAELAALDDAAFRARFAGTSVKRTGRDRFLRNVMIAIGNAGDAKLAPAAEARLADASPLVRAMAVWALSRLLKPEAFAALRVAHGTRESDADVRVEWEAGAS